MCVPDGAGAGQPVPVQQPGTFQTEQAKLEAALPKLMEAADSTRTADAGIAARYHAAVGAGLARALRGSRAALPGSRRQGRIDDLRTNGAARPRGSAGRAGQVRPGDHDLPRDEPDTKADAAGRRRADGLGRAYVRAGRKEEAARAFTQIVDEFPQSPYAADARREMEEAKKT